MKGRIPVHGQNRRGFRTAEHRAWGDMIQRCSNPNNPRYPRYGARGIQVCEKWLRFQGFLSDMGKRPTEDHSIHRINNDENYQPGNCCWATAKEQARNRVSNRIIEFNGTRATLAEWSETTGINYYCLRQRLFKLGWTMEAAISKPIGQQHRKI